MPAPSTTYDKVEYPGYPLPQAHPRRLYALARLLGLNPPAIEGARILELGCGDGTHLLWIAEELRSAKCVGVDLAESGLARGRAAAAEMGLTNIELVQANLLDLDASLGEFDYIIAHGLYSWVPAPVRDRILALCRQNLAAEGIAMVSYNAYPGCHLRRLVGDAMRFHAARHERFADRLAAAREMGDFLTGAASGGRPYEWVLRDEFKTLGGSSKAALYHDDLAETNHPVYLVDFVEHARRYGLHYLCDTTLAPSATLGRDAEIEAQINRFARDRVEREQYTDFVQGRRFRHSLLHRNEREPDFDGVAERALEFFVAARLRHEATAGELVGNAEVRFDGEHPRSVTLAHPLLKCALHHLSDTWPEPMSAERLLAMSRASARNADPEDVGRQMLGSLLYQMAAIGIVTLMGTRWRATSTPGEKPMASALSRWQAGRGLRQVTAHDGSNVPVDTGISRLFIFLLDGNLTSDEIADRLFSAVSAGEVDVPAPLQEAIGSGRGRVAIAEGVAANLRMLAGKGLLLR